MVLTRQELSVTGRLLRRVLKQEGEPVLRMRLYRPCISPEGGAAGRLHAYYKRLAEVCTARWEGALFAEATAAATAAREASRPFPPWEAELDFCVTHHGDGLLSLFCDVAETRGDKRPVVHRTAVTWETATAAPRTLASFFPGERHWRRRLLARLAELAEARLASGESLLDPDCTARLGDWFDPGRFYLEEGRLVLFFPPDTIAPFAEGVVAFQMAVERPAPTVWAG